MTRRWAVVMAWGFSAACEAYQPRPTLVLEILGSGTAFDKFQVTADPLTDDGRMRFRSRFLVKTFSTTLPLDAAVGIPLNLVSTDGRQEIARKSWMPFVCADDPSFSQKISSGWYGKETLQAFLQDDGVLSLHSEFERELTYHCDWLSPDGKSGEGSSSMTPVVTLCSEAERRNTTVQIVDVSNPAQPVPLVSTFCQAFHWKPRNPDPVYSGVITNQIVVDQSDGASISSITMALRHCWTTTETYPVDVSAESLDASQCGGAVISVGNNATNTVIPLASGRWTLLNGPDLPGGGHQMSEVDLIFAAPDGSGRKFTAKGHVEIPIAKGWVIQLR